MSDPDLFSFFDAEESRRRADDGITRAADHANPEWQTAALAATRRCAESRPRFTTDHVHAVLTESGITTHEMRALGAVVRRAAKLGWIIPTDEYQPSARPEAHRNPKRVWRSTLYREKAA